MRGVVKHFLESKGYGFITGEDGKDYFFHVDEVKNQSKAITDGLPVRFEEAVTPKGYKALQVDILDDDMPYEVPDYVITSKTGEVKGWTIVERGKYNLSFEAKGSPDEAREGLKKRAYQLGITGIINIFYKRKTREDWGTNYKYSVHYFEGQPVSLARKNQKGNYITLEKIPSFSEKFECYILFISKNKNNNAEIYSNIAFIIVLFVTIAALTSFFVYMR